MYITSAARLAWYRSGTGTLVLTSTNSVPMNVWTHVAFCRADGVLKAFINGVVSGSAANTTDYNGSNVTKAAIGAQVQTRNGTYDWLGRIDEVRITKGRARYSGNFDPPTAQFPG